MTGGRLILIAGQIALDAEGRLVGRGDLAAQTRQVFTNLGIALTDAGAGFGDLVRLTTYVVDYQPQDLPVIVGIRNRFLHADRLPAVTLVGVQALAREGCLIEVEGMAAMVPTATR